MIIFIAFISVLTIIYSTHHVRGYSLRYSTQMMAGFGNTSPKPSRITIPSPDTPCPCGSGQTYDFCCGQYHTGKEYPKDPLAMVRSRFTALALRNIPYIIMTTHPDHEEYVPEERAGARRLWEKDLTAFVNEYEFLSLTFEDESRNRQIQHTEEDGTSSITFSAKLKKIGVDRLPEEMKETSIFKLYNGKLLYYDAIIKASLRRNTSSKPIQPKQRKVTVAKGVRKSNQ